MFLYFLKNPIKTGALCSSSKQLSQAIIKNIGLEKAQYIAEIGPGLGVFTKEIIKKKSEDATFFTIEINPFLAQKLKNNISGVEVENANAIRLLDIMKKKEIDYLDAVISGLPWSIFSQKQQDLLLNKIYSALKPEGYFTTFAYVLPTPQAKKFKAKLLERFSKVHTSKIIWNNFPPAHVYYCKK